MTSENTKVTAEFQEMVLKWVKMDDIIKEKTSEIKELKDEKKQYEEYIIHCIEQINKDMVLNINDGRGYLRRSVTKTTGALKKEVVQNVLNDLLKNPNKAMEVTEMIYKNRPQKEKITLKRTNAKKKE